MNKPLTGRRGRPPGSLNKPKHSPEQTVITIPKALAAKISDLAEKTGVNPDKIALGALVDGLSKWEGLHEGLINYNESINALIRESAGPVRGKRERRSASQSITIPQGSGDAIAVEDTLGLAQDNIGSGDPGADKPKTGATSLSFDDHALFGRDQSEASPRDDVHFEQFIHGE